MTVNQGFRWIYWWSSILSGVLFVLFYFTFEESRFIRTADEIEGQSSAAEHEHTDSIIYGKANIDSKDLDKHTASEDQGLDRSVSLAPKVGEVFDAVGFKVQLRFHKLYPEPWTEILNQMWRPLRVMSLPAVLWVRQYRS